MSTESGTKALLEQLARELLPMVLEDVRRQTGATLVAPRLMDVETAAKYIGRSVASTRELAKKGTLPTTRLDGRLQFDRRQLDRLIEERTL